MKTKRKTYKPHKPKTHILSLQDKAMLRKVRAYEELYESHKNSPHITHIPKLSKHPLSKTIQRTYKRYKILTEALLERVITEAELDQSSTKRLLRRYSNYRKMLPKLSEYQMTNYKTVYPRVLRGYDIRELPFDPSKSTFKEFINRTEKDAKVINTISGIIMLLRMNAAEYNTAAPERRPRLKQGFKALLKELDNLICNPNPDYDTTDYDPRQHGCVRTCLGDVYW